MKPTTPRPVSTSPLSGLKVPAIVPTAPQPRNDGPRCTVSETQTVVDPRPTALLFTFLFLNCFIFREKKKKGRGSFSSRVRAGARGVQERTGVHSPFLTRFHVGLYSVKPPSNARRPGLDPTVVLTKPTVGCLSGARREPEVSQLRPSTFTISDPSTLRVLGQEGVSIPCPTTILVIPSRQSRFHRTPTRTLSCGCSYGRASRGTVN